ncbi:D-alanyl-D-alanine carboxypeptidase family protein [Peptoniphilus sp.]|jgi:D-alanyl-D-alanine carboxypeptidase (penicillin-binding protein 5/6)|uniref:D-alanyl-D-alanine carboxypeptidase family protein n=1 Tax=Peptoniphilus sp. TaxID=1971214 RepID=UPI003D9029AB
MKRKVTSLILSLLILFNIVPVFAAENNVTNNDNNNAEVAEEIDPKTIRDKDILVPTKDGIQKANQIEYDLIKKYEEMPLESLTKSYLLGDAETGEVLEAYNIDEVRAMASTSKLVSIFVVLDQIKEGKLSLDDEVTIDKEASSLTGSSYKLKEGDTLSVNSLITASLVVSGNDAITALGEHIAGSTDAFVVMMNKKCKDLGLKNAHMVNPTGLTDYSIEDYNKMTTREMFTLASEILKQHPEILKYTTMASIKEESRNFIEYNTNPILGIVPEIDGLKTGYTNAAGRCVILTGLEKGTKGKSKDMRLIGITTGSMGDWQRFVSCKRLMTDAFEDYDNVKIGSLDKEVKTIEVENAQDKNIPVFQRKVGYKVLKNDEELKSVVEIKPNLVAPIEAGEKVGHIQYFRGSDLIFDSDLIVKDKVYEQGIINRFKRAFEEIFVNIEKAEEKDKAA